MNDKPRGCKGCIVGTLEAVGLFLAIAWPLLLLLQWAAEQNP